MSVSAQTKRVYLNVTSDKDVKREIGRQIVDRIVKRTQSGIDKEGDKFVKYSKAYKESLAFKVYGKSSKVDLTLSGAMLASVSIVGVDSTSVRIGFRDDQQFQKASGHIDGTGAHNALPIRDFWGLPLGDVQKIITDVVKDSGNSGLIEAVGFVDQTVTVTENTPTSFNIDLGENG